MSAFTTQSLRERLVGVLDGLEDGSITPVKAREMVKVSHAIIETAKLEIEHAKTESVLISREGAVKAEPLELCHFDESKPKSLEVRKHVTSLGQLSQSQKSSFIDHVSRLRDGGKSASQISQQLDCDVCLVTEAIANLSRSRNVSA